MEKKVKTALANVNVIVANTTLKRGEHLQLMDDVKLISDQCEIAAGCKCKKDKPEKKKAKKK